MATTTPLATIEKGALIGPVTCVRFVDYETKTGRGRLILVLVGSSLRVYDVLNGEVGCPLDECILGPAFRGHGLAFASRSAIPILSPTLGQLTLLVHGGKQIRTAILTVEWTEDQTIAQVSLAFLHQGIVELSDWILDVAFLWGFPEDSLPDGIAVVYAHNNMDILSFPSITPEASYQCEGKCLLYSARIHGDQRGALTIASGTVFQGVFLWDIPMASTDADIPIKRVFSDHEGVIFSVRFSSDGSCIISVSDDRSIRIWPADQTSKSLPVVLYGHQARVWDAQLLEKEELVVSVGEDATCRVWDVSPGEGKAIACWEGHAVKSVWSVGVSSEAELVATGGGDSGVRLWSLKDLLESRNESEDSLYTWPFPAVDRYAPEGMLTEKERKGEAFRNFVLLKDEELAITTSAGCVVVCSRQGDAPVRLLYHSAHLASYASMSASPDGDLIVCGGLTGHLVFLFPGHPDQTITMHPHASKVSDAFILPLEGPGIRGWDVLTVALDMTFSHHRVSRLVDSPGAYTVEAAGQYALPPHTIPMCAAHLPGQVLVIGSREGAVVGYNLQCGEKRQASGGTCALHAGWEVRRAHGKDSVTSVVVRRDGEETFLWSAGRDGVFCRWRLSSSPEEEWGFERVHRSRVTKGWIERLMFIGEDLLILGFWRKRFFVFNESKRFEMLSITCGGGHRRWHFTPGTAPGLKEATFAYFRKGEIRAYYAKEQEGEQLFAHPNVQEGFHGREIRKVLFLKPEWTGGVMVMATVGEDCTLRLSEYVAGGRGQEGSGRIIPLCQVKRHTSVIRSASASYGGSLFLFTCGGNGELRAWRVRVGVREGGAVDSQCMEWAVCGAAEEGMEVRIMDVTSWAAAGGDGDVHYVVAGYSDGMVRVWEFRESARTFRLLGQWQGPRCVMSIGHVQMPGEGGVFMGVGVTDGQLRMWSLAEVCPAVPVIQEAVELPDPCVTVKVHLSGVNEVAIGLVEGEAGVVQVATGGDDNAISVAWIDLPLESDGKKRGAKLISTTREVCAHASSIQGLEFIKGGRGLVSTSLDQRVSMWKVQGGSTEDPSLCWVGGIITDVPDPSTLAVIEVDGVCEIAVGGIGLEVVACHD